ncbi:Ribonuclease, partial [Globisporangium splendens]
MGKNGFYAVASGRREGVFTSWTEAEAQVKGFKGAKYKSFPTRHDAEAFLSAYGSVSTSSRVRKRSIDAEASVLLPARKQARGSDGGFTRRAVASPATTFYAVAEGHNTGVVTSWPQVLSLTNGYTRPVYRKFETREAAEAFLSGYTQATAKTATTPNRTVAVNNAATPPAAGTRTASGNGVQADAKPAALLPERYWYAVAKGRETGVFDTWAEAKPHVDGLLSASFKKFPSRDEAEAFVRCHAQSTSTSASDPDPQHPDTLVAFCDGSALQNGRRGCQAGFACVFPHSASWNIAKKLNEPRATNNRAEYFAALEAMRRANIENPSQDQMLYIFSDSMLLIRSMTEWIGSWQKNNWRKADNQPVLNRDILETLVREQGTRRIVWRHVKAHTGRTDWKSKWNDTADRAAQSAARGSGS